MKLKYFGKNIQGTWRKEQGPVAIERIRKGTASDVSDTQADFVFDSTAGTTIRVERNFLPIREDAPIEICKPDGWNATAIYASGEKEIVRVRKTKTLNKQSERSRIARRNGRSGGRELTDGYNKQEAIRDVLDLKKKTPYLSIKRCCEVVIQKKTISIGWQALAKHVREHKKKRKSN